MKSQLTAMNYHVDDDDDNDDKHAFFNYIIV